MGQVEHYLCYENKDIISHNPIGDTEVSQGFSSRPLKLNWSSRTRDHSLCGKRRKVKKPGLTHTVCCSKQLCFNPSLSEPIDSLSYICIFKLMLGFGLVWFGLVWGFFYSLSGKTPKHFKPGFLMNTSLFLQLCLLSYSVKRELISEATRLKLYRYDMSQN